MSSSAVAATVLVPVAVATIAAAGVVWRAAQDFRVQRHVEITDRFMRLVEIAEGNATETRLSTAAERVAAMELAAAFALREKMFTAAAKSFLEAIHQGSSNQDDSMAAYAALQSLKKGK